MNSSLLPTSKLGRNENHLMLLAVIAKMDKEGVESDVETLSELGKFFKSHVEYMLDNLIEEGLVEIEDEYEDRSSKAGSGDGRGSDKRKHRRDDESTNGTVLSTARSPKPVMIRLPREKKLVEVHNFSVSRKGKALLEEKKRDLAKLSVALQRLYNKKDLEELYRAISWNREWIAFMLYTGVLTTDYLEEMLKPLGLDIYRLSMTETQETLHDLGVDPGILSMGMFLAHPLMAIASYIISLVAVGRLEKRARAAKLRKTRKAPGRLEGDIYIPKID